MEPCGTRRERQDTARLHLIRGLLTIDLTTEPCIAVALARAAALELERLTLERDAAEAWGVIRGA